MIPDDIKLLLHDIRLIGGGMKIYEHPDDWQLIRNLLGDQQEVDLSDATPEFWDSIRHSLAEVKQTAFERSEKRYLHGLYYSNPFN
ncbi:hypothetical protein [Brevibacillus choshinensis]|uniref:Uncharacterized protein n=1 Tax=Brevibacillus choshinensis TaxID=54911 RepID=A0ABX7FV56_BRECH|nr:hypothetical protein [Brevibacillus choshinensis]QRG69593.1 hypothetical protein JNE38_10990 [Brevibacillus choshinensis]